MSDIELGLPSPETYEDMPILFIVDSTGAMLFGMEKYRAGNGDAPQLGDQMVLHVLGPESWSYGSDHQKVVHPRQTYLDGIYEVLDVRNGKLATPFLQPAIDEYWGLGITKVRDITSEEEIDRVENAGLLSMI